MSIIGNYFSESHCILTVMLFDLGIVENSGDSCWATIDSLSPGNLATTEN